jgi:hypothetical protein
MVRLTRFESENERLEFCSSLERALSDLRAAAQPAPAATGPEDANSRLPDPPAQARPRADLDAEIERLERELRESGCEGWS